MSETTVQPQTPQAPPPAQAAPVAPQGQQAAPDLSHLQTTPEPKAPQNYRDQLSLVRDRALKEEIEPVESQPTAEAPAQEAPAPQYQESHSVRQERQQPEQPRVDDTLTRILEKQTALIESITAPKQDPKPSDPTPEEQRKALETRVKSKVMDRFSRRFPEREVRKLDDEGEPITVQEGGFHPDKDPLHQVLLEEAIERELLAEESKMYREQESARRQQEEQMRQQQTEQQNAQWHRSALGRMYGEGYAIRDPETKQVIGNTAERIRATGLPPIAVQATLDHINREVVNEALEGKYQDFPANAPFQHQSAFIVRKTWERFDREVGSRQTAPPPPTPVPVSPQGQGQQAAPPQQQPTQAAPQAPRMSNSIPSQPGPVPNVGAQTFAQPEGAAPSTERPNPLSPVMAPGHSESNPLYKAPSPAMIRERLGL